MCRNFSKISGLKLHEHQYGYYYYYLLQLSCHSVAVVLTLVQTKQIRIIYINETIQKHNTNNTKHRKYKDTYYQNTHTYT